MPFNRMWGVLLHPGMAAAILFASLFALVPAAHAQSSLSCSPAQQTAAAGQTVTFQASGGDGSYVWGTPSGVFSTSGSTFSTTFTEPGPNTVVVTSGGDDAVCVVNVVGGVAGGNVGGFPGLPHTGDGGGASAGTFSALMGAVVLSMLALAGLRGFRMIFAS